MAHAPHRVILAFCTSRKPRMTTERRDDQSILPSVSAVGGASRGTTPTRSITPSRPAPSKKLPKRPSAQPKRAIPNSLELVNDIQEDRNRAFATGDPKYNTECPAAMCPCGERIGNMVVLHESESELGRSLWVVAGPFWPVMVFFTLPAVIGLSYLVSSTLLADTSAWALGGYWMLSLWTCGCLLVAGLTDPGIVPYYPRPPPGREGWPFSQQAKSFRPPKALYSRDCNGRGICCVCVLCHHHPFF